MKKFILPTVSILVLAPSITFANTYTCPTADEATKIITDHLATWNGWTIVSAHPVPVASNGTFLEAIIPAKNAKTDDGQTLLSVGCNYTAAPNYPSSTTSINMTHGNLNTFAGLTGNWIQDVNNWATCNGTNPQGCQFTDAQ